MGFLPLKVGEVSTKKTKVLHANQNSTLSNMTYCKCVMTHRCGDCPNTLEDHPVPRYPFTAILQTQTPGQAFEILDVMAPLVIKLFESPYLCSVSWETPPSPSPDLGAVPLSQAWEPCKKAVTREWRAGETSQQHQKQHASFLEEHHLNIHTNYWWAGHTPWITITIMLNAAQHLGCE